MREAGLRFPPWHPAPLADRYRRRLSSPTSGPGVEPFLGAQESSEHSPGPAAPTEDSEHGSEPAKLAKVGDKNSKDMSQPSAEQGPFVLHA